MRRAGGGNGVKKKYAAHQKKAGAGTRAGAQRSSAGVGGVARSNKRNGNARAVVTAAGQVRYR